MRATLRSVAGVALVLGLVLAAAPVSAVIVLAPFPAGDDQVRAAFVLSGATCGASAITTSSRQVIHENLPVGAEYSIRSIDNGIVADTPPLPAPWSGSGTADYAGFSFGSNPYPRTVGLQIVIFVGGERTYLGGQMISCAGVGATPTVELVEVFLPPCGVGDAAPFLDVPADHPFCDDVAWAVERGITEGYPDDTFRPTNPVTRQAAVAFLYRLSGSPLGPDPSCSADAFSDVPIGHPFCGEIEWAKGGFITGYPDGTFRPGAVVSRQATAAFLYRYAGSPDGLDPTCASAPFSDVPTSHPYCGEIDWLVDAGITNGYPDGLFKPANTVSRQAIVAFLHRLADAT